MTTTAPAPARAPEDVNLSLLPVAEMLRRLGCTADGLTAADAARRLAQDGPNRLGVTGRTRIWTSIAHQLTYPLASLG